jgi:PAS domain-containing protein
LTKECTYFNKAWLDFAGRTFDQEYGYGWLEGVRPEQRAGCCDIYVAAFDARKPFSMEYEILRHDGQYRWILDNGVRLPSRACAVACAVVCAVVRVRVRVR